MLLLPSPQTRLSHEPPSINSINCNPTPPSPLRIGLDLHFRGRQVREFECLKLGNAAATRRCLGWWEAEVKVTGSGFLPLSFLSYSQLRVSSENGGRLRGKARFRELGCVSLMQHICTFSLCVKGQVQQRRKHPCIDCVRSTHLCNFQFQFEKYFISHDYCWSHSWYHICSYKHKVLNTLNNV